MARLWICSGVSRATSSMSTPPAADTIITGRLDLRSTMTPRYASLAMSICSATRTFLTVSPLRVMPRILDATDPASSGDPASFTPPALPLPPAWTWALTTTGALSSRAMASTSRGEPATFARQKGTPARAMISRAWYS